MSKLIEQARAFAQFAHAGQVRRYTLAPYWKHPQNVAANVERWLADWPVYPQLNEQITAAAWLHDVLEDTPITAPELLWYFGETVCNLVEELTDVYTSAKYVDLNRSERKRLETVRLGGISPAARLIKRADIADNTSDVETYDPKFARVYMPEKEAILAVFDLADARDSQPGAAPFFH